MTSVLGSCCSGCPNLHAVSYTSTVPSEEDAHGRPRLLAESDRIHDRLPHGETVSISRYLSPHSTINGNTTGRYVHDSNQCCPLGCPEQENFPEEETC